MSSLGSLFSNTVFSHVSIKLVLALCLFFDAAVLFLFAMTSSFPLLCLSRFLMGVFQAFLLIYFPIWVDTFALEKLKSLWFTALLFAPSFGIMAGYSLQAFLNAPCLCSYDLLSLMGSYSHQNWLSMCFGELPLYD